jgi:DNA-binding CsgD family transcriptional regulator
MSEAAQIPLPGPASVPDEELTIRETEILLLIADGLSSKAIAARLGISFKTVACHRYRILQKTGHTSTVGAVRWAIRRGLVQP